MTLLSTHEASRVRNLALSALHHIAAETLCEVPDILALLGTTSHTSISKAHSPFTRLESTTPSQPGSSSHAPAVQTDGEAEPSSSQPSSPSVEPTPPTPPTGDAQFRNPLDWEDEDEAQPAPMPQPRRGRPETVRSKIVAVHAEHPEWPSKLIAQHLGISEDAVRATASRKSLKLVSWWDYERALKVQTTEALKAPAKAPEAEAPPPALEARPEPVRPPATIPAAPLPPPAIKVMRSAPTGRFYLREKAAIGTEGRFVHQSLAPCPTGPGPMMTSDRKWAWYDTMERYRGAVKQWPELAEMRKEAAAS